MRLMDAALIYLWSRETHMIGNPPPSEREAIIRGEKLFNHGRLEPSLCQTLLELFVLVRRAGQHAADALSIIANRRGLDPLDVRDACINVAFGCRPGWPS